jgi:hypothetical protein
MVLTFSQLRMVRLALLGCLLVCLLGLATGCSTPKSTDMGEVSGTVTFNGKPLPGGRVTFVSKGGQAFSTGGNIDENGHYKIEAPIGEVNVSVDNRMLGASSDRRGPSGPAERPNLKRPGSEAAKPMAGHFVKIPEKYHSASESGLTFTIKKGSQTIDIPLQE